MAIYNAATDSIIAVNTAIDAYEDAVITAINTIVPAVTEAAGAIGTQVAGVAAIASDAVTAAIEKAEELDAIVAALNNVVYDATHAEVNLNCGEQLAIYGVYAEALAQAMNAVVAEDAADADVITVSFDGDGFINYMIAQIMGLAADEINDEITRNNLGSLLARFGADELIAEFIDLSQSYTAPDWTGFDADAIAAKNDMLVIIKNVLTEQGVPATYSEKLVNLLDMAKDMVDAETATLIADIQGIMNQDLDVEVPVIEILLDAAESVLYSYFTFAVEFPAELNAIRAAAPEAQVVVIGLSDAIAAALPEFADYITMVVDALNAHLFAYAAINTNTTYVADAAEIPAAITVTYADCVWGATTYEWVKVGNAWTCTATRVCTNNAAHVETANATITSAEKIPATTTEMGTTTYTATFDVEWATTQTKDVQDIAKLPSGPSGPVGGGGGGWRCTGGNHCPSCQFTDLAEVIKSNPRIWWHEYTDYVIKNKLMNGMTDTLFMPNYTTTRAMLVTILWREAGSPVVDFDMAFEDVEANTWYTEAIRWAASKGIVDGMSDTEFAPNANITREQMVTIFYRYAKFNKVNVTTGNAKNIERFSDVDEISSWAYDAVKWACGIGFVDGKENNNIDPTGNATRVEMATLIMRFIENVM